MENTKTFNLPDLGEGLLEAELRQWYVKEGDYVEIDQPIASMETAKALVDIPAPQSGYISKRYPKMNDIVSIDRPLVSFSDHPLDHGHSAECYDPLESRSLDENQEFPQTVSDEIALVQNKTSLNKTIHAMPAVKAFARKFNVDLNTVIPSALNGSITLNDVKAVIDSSLPLSGTRRAMAININKAHTEKIISGVLCEDADIQAWDNKQDYTLRLIRALIMACRAEPALNAHYYNNSLTRQLFTNVNIGLAMDTPSGLYVPVLKAADKYEPEELREQINQFKYTPHTPLGKGSPESLAQSSIILSNFGSIGGRYAMPVIIPPIVAIIATGRARDQVMAIAGKTEVRKIIPLTLAFDHRAVTGGEAARFLMAMIADLSFQA